MNQARLLAFLVASTITTIHASADAQELRVVGTKPTAHAVDADPGASIEVRFDRAVARASVDTGTFWAFGRWSGPVAGSLTFAAGDSVVRLVPSVPLSFGERVMVVLAHDLRGADDSTMRDAGYSFRFWTRSAPADLELRQLVELSTRSEPAQSTRSYGGFAANLNGDRLLDLAIVNEVSADVRVFLNSGDAANPFRAFLQPPTRVGQRASPSETSDFNRDGEIDACVANIDANTVSILLGRGDGTFTTQQTLAVGLQPRGVTVFDADGDGDVDIVTCSVGSDDALLLTNDGRGNFQSGLPFDAGGDGEWAVEAADMDDDGILDLVVGCQLSETVHVNRGLGDGTFEEVDSASSGGPVWMLNTGDVDGDGLEDVVVVNSRNNNAAVLAGIGNGRLGEPRTVGTDPFPLATDLADLDGDGDLDWITSSFSGDWMLFTNDGNGGFGFAQRFPAPVAASCSIAFDCDGDGDLDVAFVDEIADVVLIYENAGTSTAVERRSWGDVKRRFRR